MMTTSNDFCIVHDSDESTVIEPNQMYTMCQRCADEFRQGREDHLRDAVAELWPNEEE